MFPISDSIKTRRFPLLNILIIFATVIVFLNQIFRLDENFVINNLALIPSTVDFSNFKTFIPFITAIFLHGGFLHIISNMWFLWIFGDNVEDYFGAFYIFVYIISGIVGNLIQFLLMSGSSIPMLGASGAVAGALGAYYVLYPHSKIKTIVPVFFFPLIIKIAAPVMLGYWFVLQLIAGAATLPFTGSETGGIAFFAHAGGFVTGALFALLFRGKKSKGLNPYLG